MREHAMTIKRGWKLIAALVVLGVVVGGLMTTLMPARYVSTTRFFVASAVDSEDPDELFDRNQIAGQRVKSYVELIRSDAMTAAVIDEVGDDFDLDRDLFDDVTATTLPETVIIDVQVTGSSAEEARRVAEAYAAVAPKEVAAVESVGTAKAAQVALSVIEVPTLGERESPTIARGLVFGGLLGLVGGLGGVVLWGALRRENRAVEPRSLV